SLAAMRVLFVVAALGLAGRPTRVAPTPAPSSSGDLVLPNTVPNGRVELVIKPSYANGKDVTVTVRLIPSTGTLRGPLEPYVQASGFAGTQIVKHLAPLPVTATAAKAADARPCSGRSICWSRSVHWRACTVSSAAGDVSATRPARLRITITSSAVRAVALKRSTSPDSTYVSLRSLARAAMHRLAIPSRSPGSARNAGRAVRDRPRRRRDHVRVDAARRARRASRRPSRRHDHRARRRSPSRCRVLRPRPRSRERDGLGRERDGFRSAR